jgi:hypothetical protein
MSLHSRILTLATILAILRGVPSTGALDLPMGATLMDNSLSGLPPRKRCRKLITRLKRHISRYIRWCACNYIQSDYTGSLDSCLSAKHNDDPIYDVCSKLLALIHFRTPLATLGFNDNIIAYRLENDTAVVPLHKEFDIGMGSMSGVDEYFPIGELHLCTRPTLNLVRMLRNYCWFCYGGFAFTNGGCYAYQHANPLQAGWKYDEFHPLAESACKPNCQCDDCRSQTSRCLECLDDICPHCEDTYRN